jgi:hypothetical protein
MADIADLLSHSNMFTLNNLGVTARAPEFQSTAEFPQMILVVEDDRTLKFDLSFQDPRAMAVGLHAYLIFYLSPGACNIAVSNVSGERGIEKAHSIRVTLHTGNTIVGRGLPAIIVGLHVMTKGARGGIGREEEEGDISEDENTNSNEEQLNERFTMGDNPSPYTLH